MLPRSAGGRRWSPPPSVSFLARRSAQSLFVLWAAYTVSFVVLFLLPGDPVAVMVGGSEGGGNVDPGQVERLRAEYGYDRPLWAQYLSGAVAAAGGDFGRSVATGAEVRAMILGALPATAALAGLALLLALALGLTVAVTATFTRLAWLRHLLLAYPPLAVSVPTFWSGLLLAQFVSFHLGLLPAAGNQGFAALILPAVSLALPLGAVLAQVLARSLDEALTAPYVQAVTAKGAGRLRVHLGHALRNAVMPALTVLGMMTGHLLSGALVVEQVFARSGLGRVTIDAVTKQDIPVVQGVVVLCALVFALVNLIVDLLQPVIEPRTRTFLLPERSRG